MARQTFECSNRREIGCRDLWPQRGDPAGAGGPFGTRGAAEAVVCKRRGDLPGTAQVPNRQQAKGCLFDRVGSGPAVLNSAAGTEQARSTSTGNSKQIDSEQPSPAMISEEQVLCEIRVRCMLEACRIKEKHGGEGAHASERLHILW